MLLRSDYWYTSTFVKGKHAWAKTRSNVCLTWSWFQQFAFGTYLFQNYYLIITFFKLLYKFVKGFLAITFLLLVIFWWNFHDVCQRFLYNQEQNFRLIRQKTKIFPIDPIIKIAHFCTLQKWAIRHDVTKVGDFYNGGLWGNFSFFVGSYWNFVPGYIKKLTHLMKVSARNNK